WERAIVAQGRPVAARAVKVGMPLHQRAGHSRVRVSMGAEGDQALGLSRRARVARRVTRVASGVMFAVALRVTVLTPRPVHASVVAPGAANELLDRVMDQKEDEDHYDDVEEYVEREKKGMLESHEITDQVDYRDVGMQWSPTKAVIGTSAFAYVFWKCLTTSTGVMRAQRKRVRKENTKFKQQAVEFMDVEGEASIDEDLMRELREMKEKMAGP
ncbi:unnamed protein product, partial [Chrysoparadoxa australica]